MQLIADILSIAAAFAAAIYCYVLAARLTRFSTLETGMGGAIAVLSAQVDDMTCALRHASATAAGSATSLETLTGRAENVAAKLELLMASMHDLPEVADSLPPDEDDKTPERKLRFMRRRSSRAEMEQAL